MVGMVSVNIVVIIERAWVGAGGIGMEERALFLLLVGMMGLIVPLLLVSHECLLQCLLVLRKHDTMTMAMVSRLHLPK